MTSPITPTEILDEVIQPIEPSFAPDFARLVLGMRLSDTAQERIRALLRRNNAGALEPTKEKSIENYLLVGQFIDLLLEWRHPCGKTPSAPQLLSCCALTSPSGSTTASCWRSRDYGSKASKCA